MKTSSAKAKGRNLQQWVVKMLIKHLKIDEEDVESRAMGSQGEDVVMSKAAKQKFPFSIECKNQERLNLWEAYEQSKSNCGKYEPLVIIKKNHKKPLAVLDAEFFIKLMKGL